jgi:ribosomal protein L37AE/L43A
MIRFTETASESMGRMATDIDECPMCGSVEFETVYGKERDKHICTECCYKWIEINE